MKFEIAMISRIIDKLRVEPANNRKRSETPSGKERTHTNGKPFFVITGYIIDNLRTLKRITRNIIIQQGVYQIFKSLIVFKSL